MVLTTVGPNMIELGCKVAMESLHTDYSITPPKTPEERANGFAAWIAYWQSHWNTRAYQTFCGYLSVQGLTLSSEEVRRLAEEHLFPQVRHALEQFAVGYYAGGWLRKHFGDATTLGMAVPDSAGWRVPLGVRDYEKNLGQIILDREGNVIPHLTTTRSEILAQLEMIDGSQLPAPATATR